MSVGISLLSFRLQWIVEPFVDQRHVQESLSVTPIATGLNDC